MTKQRKGSEARTPIRDAVIVDDMRINRRVLEVHLERLGYHCRHAASGPEAIAACETRRPDVLLLDVVMPGMDGIEAAALIRALPGCADVPILLLTGLEAAEVGARATTVGISAVLDKPVQADALRSALRRHVPAPVTAVDEPTAGRRPARKRPTRVLVVDDSALVRKVLTEIIASDPTLEVVGTARDARRAWEKIQRLSPDVLTLDIEMPGMDGLTFLARLMSLRPTPVVMISALTERGSRETIRALELGAIDFVAKPRLNLAEGIEAMAAEMIAKVKVAAQAHLPQPPLPPLPPVTRTPSVGYATAADTVVAIGASTGGPRALAEIVTSLPADFPPVVIVQHMPATFTGSFAARLDGLSAVDVQEAQGGETLRAGLVLIAPGHSHLVVERGPRGLVTRLHTAEPVNYHRPSVDVLFDSLADVHGDRTVGVILTGMGADGARGLAALRRAGATTIGQDEATCLIYGMPRVAAELGAVERALPLHRIPAALVKLTARASRRRRA
jgi:two-component system chemotaxis response regulator CheB